MGRKDRKSNTSAGSQIPPEDDNFWYAPAGAYAVSEKEQIMVAIGDNQPAYRLDLRKEQNRLLAKYGNIQSEEEYKSWLLEFMGDRKFELIGDWNGIPIHQSAQSLKELLKILHYYQNKDSPALFELISCFDCYDHEDTEENDEEITERMFEELKREVERCFDKKSTFPWWEDYINSKDDYLITLDDGGLIKYDYLQYAKDAWNYYKYKQVKPGHAQFDEHLDGEEYKHFLARREKQKANDAIMNHLKRLEREVTARLKTEADFSFDNVEIAFYKIHGGFTGDGIPRITFSKQTWEDDRNGSIIKITWAFLIKAANIMLRGIEPGLQYDTQSKTLKLRYQLTHPWHAIATAFAERILKQPLVINKCHICGEDINYKKVTAKLCDKVGCKRAHRKKCNLCEAESK
jgi:hypothetical protein